MSIAPLTSGTASPKISIKLLSFDPCLIENAVFCIKNALSSTAASMKGPIPLPCRRKTFTVNTSPHIDKKAREHFEIITSMRLLDLTNCDSKVVNALSSISLPTGVEIRIRYCDNVKSS